VKGKIVMTTTDETTSAEFQDVYRVHLSRMADRAPLTDRYALGKTGRTALPDAPLTVRLQRGPGDPGDTFIKPTGLAAVKVTPLQALPKPRVVQDGPGYHSWPTHPSIGGKLVCVYGRGKGQTIASDDRAADARTSTDGGKPLGAPVLSGEQR
jgi:hypothetical protein